MLEVQAKYLTYLNAVEVEIQRIELSEDLVQGFKLDILKEAINNTQLTVPVIGGYSAGKSTLLNSLLSKEYLPIGITPETALAAELHYSTTEYIEAVKPDNLFDKYAILDVEQIKQRAKEYKFLRMYINSPSLQTIQPLILVDMPGFDSPLDLHNKAIMEYLNKGVHYILLTSVEDGTLTRSIIRQISDIQEFGRDLSFFLSKTNLRAASEVDEIKGGIIGQLDDYCDIKTDVVSIDDNGGRSLQKILTEISPEQLFENEFISELKDRYFSISDAINTSISVFGKDKDSNQKVIVDLQVTLDDLINERDKLIKGAQEQYSDTQVDDIVEAVGKELSNSIEELSNIAVVRGCEALTSSITEIARHSLLSNIRDSLSDIGEDIVDKLAFNLSTINSSMSDFTMSEDWLEKTTGSIKNLLNSAKGGINTVIDNRNKQGDTDKIYKVITTILAVTTSVLTPVIELIIVFIPDLFSGVFNKITQEKQKEKIRNTILTQIIPSIKREIRSKLPKIFNEQVKDMISSISSQFEVVINEKQEIITQTQKKMESKIIDIAMAISTYQEVNNNVTSLANEALYK